MTDSHADQVVGGVGGAATAAAPQGDNACRRVRVLLFSSDRGTRDAVRIAVGSRPARDVAVEEWFECATAEAVRGAIASGRVDVMVLDGEATPLGGLGLSRQMKDEFHSCPPVIVLTGRPQDAWLAAWSYAERAVPHPLDPLALCDALADVARHLPADA